MTRLQWSELECMKRIPTLWYPPSCISLLTVLRNNGDQHVWTALSLGHVSGTCLSLPTGNVITSPLSLRPDVNRLTNPTLFFIHDRNLSRTKPSTFLMANRIVLIITTKPTNRFVQLPAAANRSKDPVLSLIQGTSTIQSTLPANGPGRPQAPLAVPKNLRTIGKSTGRCCASATHFTSIREEGAVVIMTMMKRSTRSGSKVPKP